MVVLLLMTLNGVFADIASIREKTIQPNLLCLIDDEETDIFYFPARIAFLDKVKVNFGFHNEEISFIEDKVLVSGFYLPNLYKKFGVGFDGYFVKNENGWGVLWDAFNGSGSSSYYTSDFLVAGKVNLVYSFNTNFAGFIGIAINRDTISQFDMYSEFWRTGNYPVNFSTSTDKDSSLFEESENKNLFTTGISTKSERITIDFTLSLLKGNRSNNDFWFYSSVKKEWVQNDTTSSYSESESATSLFDKNFWGTEGFLRLGYALTKNRWLRLFGAGHLDLGNSRVGYESRYEELYWSLDSTYLSEENQADIDTFLSYRGNLKVGLGLEERVKERLLFGLGAMYYISSQQDWDLSFGFGLEYKFTAWAKIRYGLAPIYNYNLLKKAYQSKFRWEETINFLESFDFSHRIGIGLSLSDWCRVDLLCSTNFAELKNIETEFSFSF